ncbi:hypothetical protein HEP86_23915 [Streptomyces sp. RPA4-5]|uniref:hypothetical protein n=1 Tax=unclassified Streptomyces TaxID=2593676 RepID=UPI00143EBAD0|nr:MULTISPECIES: hypothetical protein [unclassified Streptomyces]QIY53172.1 hypothetical protein HEP86_23915 [Streptomyces sp. RPA4-5]WJY39991.1 hypothetical protein QT196_23440 [Streptomyces sp. P9-2B-2]
MEDNGRRTIVTDIHQGVYLLRCGSRVWPAVDPVGLRIIRTRAQRIADGDFR